MKTHHDSLLYYFLFIYLTNALIKRINMDCCGSLKALCVTTEVEGHSVRLRPLETQGNTAISLSMSYYAASTVEIIESFDICRPKAIKPGGSLDIKQQFSNLFWHPALKTTETQDPIASQFSKCLTIIKKGSMLNFT